MTRAFGDEARFAVNDDIIEVEALLDGSYHDYYTRYRDQFKAHDYVPDGPLLHATISRANADPSCQTPYLLLLVHN